MDTKLLAPMKITKHQRKWIEDEQKRTGSTAAAVVRALLQSKVDEKGI
jgi:hypothetical protein